MIVNFDVKAIRDNIDKANDLANGKEISLMFKDFYEDVLSYIPNLNNKVFAMNHANSVCYSIGKANKKQVGAVVTSLDNLPDVNSSAFKNIYIPINAHDNREGLAITDAKELAERIKCIGDCKVYGMITSGCINERFPSVRELHELWNFVNKEMDSISLGGSFWLGKNYVLPEFISDIRIGEYMLFGTIPFNTDKTKMGKCAVSIEANIIGVYPEREQLIIDCGYTMADVDKCKTEDGLYFVDSSSEYAIYNADTKNYKVGDVVRLIPNYKSLVKLKYAVRNYLQTE